LEALLALLVPALERRGHDAISVRFLGTPQITSVLTRHRFQYRGADRSIIVRPTAGCPVAPEILRDARMWYVTDLDEDT
ncbi:MAG TPA: hypothetical protein VGC42_19285, partial [Kofleriaceae bacterium]